MNTSMSVYASVHAFGCVYAVIKSGKEKMCEDNKVAYLFDLAIISG